VSHNLRSTLSTVWIGKLAKLIIWKARKWLTATANDQKECLRSWRNLKEILNIPEIPGLNWKSLKSTSKKLFGNLLRKWIPGKSPWDKKAGWYRVHFSLLLRRSSFIHHHVQFISSNQVSRWAKDNSLSDLCYVPHSAPLLMFKIMNWYSWRLFTTGFQMFTGHRKVRVRPGLYIARNAWNGGAVTITSQVNKSPI